MSGETASATGAAPGRGSRRPRRAGRRRVRRHGWTRRDLLVCLAAAAIGLVVTADAWIDVFVAGGLRVLAMPVVVLPCAAWLAWIRRSRLRITPAPAPTLFGPLLMAAGWHLHAVVGVSSPTASGLGSLLVTVGCVVSVAGVQMLRPFLPAFAALLFLVPLPGGVRERLFPLLLETRAAVAAWLPLGSETAGSAPAAAATPFSGGLHVIAGLTVVGYAFAFGAGLRRVSLLAFLAIAPLLAIALDGARVATAQRLATLLPAGAARAVDAASAWLCLPVAALLLLGLLRLLQRARVPVTRFHLAYRM